MAATAKNTVKSLPATITEAELQKYLIDRAQYVAAKKAYDALKKDIEAREEDIIARLEGGAKVKSTVFTVAVDRSAKRRVVAWKDAYVSELGEAKAEALIAATPETVYPKLAVTAK